MSLQFLKLDIQMDNPNWIKQSFIYSTLSNQPIKFYSYSESLLNIRKWKQRPNDRSKSFADLWQRFFGKASCFNVVKVSLGNEITWKSNCYNRRAENSKLFETDFKSSWNEFLCKHFSALDSQAQGFFTFVDFDWNWSRGWNARWQTLYGLKSFARAFRVWKYLRCSRASKDLIEEETSSSQRKYKRARERERERERERWWWLEINVCV